MKTCPFVCSPVNILSLSKLKVNTFLKVVLKNNPYRRKNEKSNGKLISPLLKISANKSALVIVLILPVMENLLNVVVVLKHFKHSAHIGNIVGIIKSCVG